MILNLEVWRRTSVVGSGAAHLLDELDDFVALAHRQDAVHRLLMRVAHQRIDILSAPRAIRLTRQHPLVALVLIGMLGILRGHFCRIGR